MEENDGPFSSTFRSFYVMCDILPNLDENETLFLYREQNEQNYPKLDGCGHPLLEGYLEM